MMGIDRIIFAIGALLIALLGLVGNSIVCILVLQKKTTRNTFNCLLLNLAVSDLLCTLTGILLYLSVISSCFFASSADISEDKNAIFKTVLAITGICARNSIFTLSAISLERYYAVVRPLEHRAVTARRNMKLVSLIIWMTSLITGLPIFIFLANLPDEYPADCQGAWITSIFQCSKVTNSSKDLALWTSLVIYPPPMLVILKTSLAVIKHLWWKQRRNTVPGANKTLLQHRKRITKVVLSVLVAFNAFWLPWMVIQGLVLSNANTKINDNVVLGTLLLIMAYAAANPLLYTFQSQQFRRRIKKLVCRSVKVKHGG